MKTVTVGVLGAGRIGRLHTENLFRMAGVRVKSIADPYADFDAWPPPGIDTGIDPSLVLDDPEIQAVLICSPTPTHADFTEAAATAGATQAAYIFLRLPHEVKDIFIEWLDTHFPDRAGRVMSLVREAGGGRDYDNRFGIRQTGRGAYADILGKRFRAACSRNNLERDRYQKKLVCDLFHPPGQQQLGLF